MTQLALIEVPKDSPSRKERLDALKKAFGIETCDGGPSLLPNRWLACHMPRARKFRYGVHAESDLFDVVSKVGRLLDEAGVTQYGATEREAVGKVLERVMGIKVI